MRVLFSTSPAIGHFYPLLPLARELQRAGHEVAVLTSGALAAHVREAGLDILPAGPPVEELLGAALERYPGSDDPATALNGLTAFAEIRLERSMPEALIAARQWRPDMIISEHADFLGPLVATMLDVPHVTQSFGPGQTPQWLRKFNTSVAPSYVRHGLTPPAHAGLYQDAYIDTCPPALQLPDFSQPAPVLAMRPEPHHAPDGDWVRPTFAKPDRRLVLLTMGTVFGRPDVFDTALAGLEELDANVLVALGPAVDPAGTAFDPSWIQAHRFLPLDRVLPECDLMVAHGGAGTMLASLACGVPMVLVPQGADQFTNAERATAAGAAVTIMPDSFCAEAVAEAAAEVTGDAGFTTAAQTIRDQIDAMPDPASVAKALLSLRA